MKNNQRTEITMILKNGDIITAFIGDVLELTDIKGNAIRGSLEMNASFEPELTDTIVSNPKGEFDHTNVIRIEIIGNNPELLFTKNRIDRIVKDYAIEVNKQ